MEIKLKDFEVNNAITGPNILEETIHGLLSFVVENNFLRLHVTEVAPDLRSDAPNLGTNRETYILLSK